MPKSVAARSLVPVDYDGNGTFDLGFFRPIAGSPRQGQLGSWLLGKPSGSPTFDGDIGNSFVYGNADSGSWVPGLFGNGSWFLDGSALLTPDFNGDGKTDQLFGRRVVQGYELGFWFMDGANVTSYKSLVNVNGQAAIIPTAWSDPNLYLSGAVRGSGNLSQSPYNAIGGQSNLGDFNGDGTSDLLLLRQNLLTGGTEVGLWLINNGVAVVQQTIQTAPAGWRLVSTNDFDGNGTTDLLFTRGVGLAGLAGTEVGIWTLNGTQILGMAGVNIAPAGWQLRDTNDFNGDGKADLLWTDKQVDNSTKVGMWLMNGTQATAYGEINVAPAGWALTGSNDFNGDGKVDLLFEKRLEDGQSQFGLWLLNGVSPPLAYQVLDTVAAGSGWTYWLNGDTNGDGIADLLFYNRVTRDVGVWQLGTNGLPRQQKVIGRVSGDWQPPFLLDSFSSSSSGMPLAALEGGGSELFSF
jgi:hypothetical protein